MAKVLTIVVTYNGMHWLAECLNSVVQSHQPSDLFIIDNGSNDGSISFIKENYPTATLIESKDNLGFGKANNIGLQYALKHDYDFVYLLNQDAWIEPTTLTELIKASETNPEYGVLSPLQLTREKTHLDDVFAHHVPRDMISAGICHQLLRNVYEVRFIMAAHWLITRKCLETVGGFSPAFPHYGEDNNYLQRLKFHKLKVGIVPDAIGVHDRENRSLTLEKKQYMYYINNLILFNNPNLKHRFIRFIANSLSSKNQSAIRLNYLLKSLRGYLKSLSLRQESKKPGAFLE